MRSISTSLSPAKIAKSTNTFSCGNISLLWKTNFVLNIPEGHCWNRENIHDFAKISELQDILCFGHFLYTLYRLGYKVIVSAQTLGLIKCRVAYLVYSYWETFSLPILKNIMVLNTFCLSIYYYIWVIQRNLLCSCRHKHARFTHLFLLSKDLNYTINLQVSGEG